MEDLRKNGSMRDDIEGGYDNEPLESQIGRLARFIMAEFPGEPSRPEGAVDTAIRLLRKCNESHS